MTQAHLAGLALLAAFSLGASAGAQQRDSLLATASECRGFNGIYVDAWWGGAPGDSSGANSDSGGFRFDGRRAIDTTFTFDVAERRWSRPSVTAVVLAGVSSQAARPTATGTTPASPTDSRRGWHVCTGATISGRDPTLVLRGVRGQIHLKVDLTVLANVRGAAPSDTSRFERR